MGFFAHFNSKGVFCEMVIVQGGFLQFTLICVIWLEVGRRALDLFYVFVCVFALEVTGVMSITFNYTWFLVLLYC